MADDARLAKEWQPCGGLMHTETAEHPAAEQCGDCEPRPCDDCGQLSHPSAPCGCWIDLTTMPLADVKALFVADGWNVSTDGGLTRG